MKIVLECWLSRKYLPKEFFQAIPNFILRNIFDQQAWNGRCGFEQRQRTSKGPSLFCSGSLWHPDQRSLHIEWICRATRQGCRIWWFNQLSRRLLHPESFSFAKWCDTLLHLFARAKKKTRNLMQAHQNLWMGIKISEIGRQMQWCIQTSAETKSLGKSRKEPQTLKKIKILYLGFYFLNSLQRVIFQ